MSHSKIMERCSSLFSPATTHRVLSGSKSLTYRYLSLTFYGEILYPSYLSSIAPLKCSIKSDAYTPTNDNYLTSTSVDATRGNNLGLVFDLGQTGSWDCEEVGSPIVKRFISDEEERWYMWYHGNSKEGKRTTDSIGLAVSKNGVHWERGKGNVGASDDVGLVMQCSSDWWAFDRQSVRPSDIVVMSSSQVRTSSAVYWLFYTGSFTDGVNKSLPGLAMSQDGRYWARIEGEHHTGALFEAGNAWDSLFIANPNVVVHDIRDLRLYYDTVEAATGEHCIGVATSRDGMKWMKEGKILGPGKGGCFDEGGVRHCSVSKVRNMYVMAYEGIDWKGRRSIGVAESGDGLRNWRKVKEEAVLEPSQGWDSGGVGSPCLLEIGDHWRLYYTGVGHNGRPAIGLAVSHHFPSFERCSTFYL